MNYLHQNTAPHPEFPGFFSNLNGLVSPYFSLTGPGLYNTALFTAMVSTTISQFYVAKFTLQSGNELSKKFCVDNIQKYGKWVAIRWILAPILELTASTLSNSLLNTMSKDLVKLSLQDNNLFYVKHEPNITARNPSKIISTDVINFNLQFTFMVNNAMQAITKLASGISNAYALDPKSALKVLGYMSVYMGIYIAVALDLKDQFDNNKNLDARIGSELQEAEKKAVDISRLRSDNYTKHKISSTIDELDRVVSKIAIDKFYHQMLISAHDLLRDDSISGKIMEGSAMYSAGNMGAAMDNSKVMAYTCIFRDMGYVITWNNLQFYKVVDFIYLTNRIAKLKWDISMIDKSKIHYKFDDSSDSIKIENIKAVDSHTNKVLLDVPSLHLSHKFEKFIVPSEQKGTDFFDTVFDALYINTFGNVTLPMPGSTQRPIIHIVPKAQFIPIITYAEIIMQKQGDNLVVPDTVVKFLHDMEVNDFIINGLNTKVSQHLNNYDKTVLQVASIIANNAPRVLILDNVFSDLPVDKQEKLKSWIEVSLEKSGMDTMTIFSEVAGHNSDDTVDVSGNSFSAAFVHDLSGYFSA